MATQGSHPIASGAQAMLPYLTVGGLLMLGWRLRHRRRAAGFALANAGGVLAASLFNRYRGGRGAHAEQADTRYDRGRTIFRNTPTADVAFDTRGIP